MGVKWSEMKPRERDALVAEKVMGYECRVDTVNQKVEWGAYYTYHRTWNSPPWDWQQKWDGKLPPYTTDISAAWEVVEKFEYHEICKYPPSNRETVSLFNNGLWYRADADTVQEAICLAALKAVGVDVE